MVHYSGYDEEEVGQIAQLMLDYLSKPVKYEALFKKYTSRKFMKAAIFVKGWLEQHRSELVSQDEQEEEEEEEEHGQAGDSEPDHEENEDGHSEEEEDDEE